MSYKKGAVFEHRIKKDLEKLDFYVLRSAGSHGIADLVALKFGETLLIQAKCNELTLNYKEWNALVSLSRTLGATPIHALKVNRKIIYRKLHGFRGPRVTGSFSLFSPDNLENESCNNPA